MWHDGITPAWAGKRSQPVPPSTPRVDHPRVGGEKPDSLTVVSSVPGSPPRGRGKVSRSIPDCFYWGITPAWAGKSAWVSG